VYSLPNILGDPNNKNKMDRACGTYEGQGRCKQGFGGETRGKENTWKT